MAASNTPKVVGPDAYAKTLTEAQRYAAHRLEMPLDCHCDPKLVRLLREYASPGADGKLLNFKTVHEPDGCHIGTIRNGIFRSVVHYETFIFWKPPGERYKHRWYDWEVPADDYFYENYQLYEEWEYGKVTRCMHNDREVEDGDSSPRPLSIKLDRTCDRVLR